MDSKFAGVSIRLEPSVRNARPCRRRLRRDSRSVVRAQRRLQFLETLPEDYDASPSPSSQPPGPNDLIDLKLS